MKVLHRNDKVFFHANKRRDGSVITIVEHITTFLCLDGLYGNPTNDQFLMVVWLIDDRRKTFLYGFLNIVNRGIRFQEEFYPTVFNLPRIVWLH